MPPRVPLLTLFTGPSCSLCQNAKTELAKVRLTHPFELKTIDIHAPEGKRWQKQYAWWIPVLHLQGNEIAKGRWDGTIVKEALEKWKEQENEAAWIAYWGTPAYDRGHFSVLGDEAEDEETDECLDRRNRCFNCGSPDHIVSTCPNPFDRQLVALSREMYNFFKSGSAKAERLHEYEEHNARRMQFCESFEAGYIRGGLLRDALGLRSSDSGDSSQEDMPWFRPMLQWGYPPGWVGDEDPKLKIRSRIEGENIWTDNTDSILIIDNPFLTPNSPDPTSIEGAEEPTLSSTVSKKPKRWVIYQTILFISERLPVYSGSPLPQLNPFDDTLSTFNSDRKSLWDRIVNGGQPLGPAMTPAMTQENQSAMVPPWRRPGAFSAFGPVGWQEVAGKTQKCVPPEIVYPIGEDANSDMDFSD